MTVTDEHLLDEFRSAGNCELCGKWFQRREPHHVFTRGLGGGTRLDVCENLISLGPSGPGGCRCHADCQSYRVPRRCVLAVVALREGQSIEQLEQCVYELRRAPKQR